MNYVQSHAHSIADPESFWAEQAQQVAWYRKPSNILETLADGTHRWFGDGVLNSSYLALDYHIEQGRGEQTALIYDSPVSYNKVRYSYLELRDEVARLAGLLRQLGVEKGDGVIIYMPMVPQAVMAMLACARLGAVHSVVFGGFAANELALRIDDAKPTLLLTASCGLEFDRVIEYKPLVDKALELARHQPCQVVVLQRPQVLAILQAGRDLDWDVALVGIEPVDPVPVASTDPLYIMYTSGTTGKPKGIVRENGGNAVALIFTMASIYGMQRGDVWWGISDVGWVVGHSLIVYGPLMAGCTTVLYEGKPVRTPDAGSYWRMVEEYRINALFCAPTAMRAIRKADPGGELIKNRDLSSIRHLFLAGEKLDSSTHEWLEQLTGKPVLDHWWQTETGWPVTAPCVGLDGHRPGPGSSNRAVPGYDVRVMDEHGQLVGPGEQGSVVIALPLPPGCSQTLWNDHSRYLEAYLQSFPGYFHTGDGGYVDDEGFVYIMGRTDDVINVAGHRLSTGEMEDLVGQHPAVAECAVIGVHDEIKGQVPLGMIVLKDGVEQSSAQLQSEMVALVREKIGALACLQRIVVVKRLPKTRSGKILRAVLRKIADGEVFTPPSTIDDTAILAEIGVALGMRPNNRP
ncbi:propionyl-CoA synthetase [Pseudomonas sp. 10B1]|uniref:propionyl-CoA synthetase n=1 Tax=unclassified Pseudomonas TaxID=196821 RepID=UPI002AB50247|nr:MULTISPECIES: propionyl-CoA synthetase [unclassified Pseudomonas]MDY7560583.1 propionyl-CoA synthetase [Pseudomonas sp. AB6]MEA9975823.1 propionyl-CoA synthetase [Pseudomonas sp. RTS4]MEA9993339.1 propionyl-CoA synthetase [Pseudomonas sp. AA4]MEB0088471.1 propionyl-CoA synthetase [Pseudomonas sp. RTI1]MEB0124174.1 propionyl-CoA synthetase [Pseudomonas sp. CCC1.2]